MSSTLYQFVERFSYDTRTEKYYVHITTGTEVAKMSWCLFTITGHLRAKMIQSMRSIKCLGTIFDNFEYILHPLFLCLVMGARKSSCEIGQGLLNWEDCLNIPFPLHGGPAMPRSNMTDEQIHDENEKLFLEQAKAYYRDLRKAAQNAPYGKIIDHADAFAFQQGRELIRKSLEQIVQEQNDTFEKKKNTGNVPADTNESISDTDVTKH
jgi:hypothetical protein